MTHDPIQYATPLGAPLIENNRRNGLIAFGIISILIGSLAGCFMIFGVGAAFMFASGAAIPNGMAAVDFIVGVATFIGSAVLLIWLGVDSIRCRRWVRPVVISLGWITLVTSLFSLGGMLMALTEQSPPTSVPVGGPGSGAAMFFFSDAAMSVWMISITVLLGIIIPAAFTWFYSTQSVRLTLIAYQPDASWTERCPLPIFAACVGLLLAGLGTAMTAFTEAVPFFGIYLNGPAAVGIIIVAAAVMFAAMVLLFRMNIIGWWLALAVIALGFISAIITLVRLGMMEFYRHGRLAGTDLNELAKSQTMSGMTPIVFATVMGMICLAYLIWVHRYFDRARKVELQ